VSRGGRQQDGKDSTHRGDRAFVAQGLEDFDPESHPILRVELERVEEQLHEHTRTKLVKFMRREISFAQLTYAA